MQSLTHPENPREVQTIVNTLVRQFDNTGKVTLATGVTQTVVRNGKCNSASVVVLSPSTVNAASAISTSYVVAASGQFTVFHSNNSQTDRAFGYVIHGV